MDTVSWLTINCSITFCGETRLILHKKIVNQYVFCLPKAIFSQLFPVEPFTFPEINLHYDLAKKIKRTTRKNIRIYLKFRNSHVHIE